MNSGIYCIENLTNGKKYIGQGKNISSRFREHRNRLEKNKHLNAHLQNAWNKYGNENFNFYIIEECLESMLIEREIFFIKFFNSKDNGYNMTNGGEGASGRIPSEKTRQKMSNSQKGKIFDSEYRKKLSESLKGKTVSEETKKKMSNSRKGKLLSPQTKSKLKGRIPWNKGMTYSEEYKRKISKSLTGRKLSDSHRNKLKGHIPWNKGKKYEK